MTGLGRDDRKLLSIVDGDLARGARRAGAHLVCRPGCTSCCHGPFSINALDAWRLRRGLKRLAADDPAIAAGITERARAERSVLIERFPGDPASGTLGEDDAAEEAWCELHRDRACPALDPESGRCLLYGSRPMSCRTFGLPVRVGARDLPPCAVCFREAEIATIEACRVTVDPEEFEEKILKSRALDPGETTIAWVLS